VAEKKSRREFLKQAGTGAAIVTRGRRRAALSDQGSNKAKYSFARASTRCE
jgi:hypothetical protein